MTRAERIDQIWALWPVARDRNVSWLRLEADIRALMNEYARAQLSAEDTLVLISEVIAVATRRGPALPYLG